MSRLELSMYPLQRSMASFSFFWHSQSAEDIAIREAMAQPQPASKYQLSLQGISCWKETEPEKTTAVKAELFTRIS